MGRVDLLVPATFVTTVSVALPAHAYLLGFLMNPLVDEPCGLGLRLVHLPAEDFWPSIMLSAVTAAMLPTLATFVWAWDLVRRRDPRMLRGALSLAAAGQRREFSEGDMPSGSRATLGRHRYRALLVAHLSVLLGAAVGHRLMVVLLEANCRANQDDAWTALRTSYDSMEPLCRGVALGAVGGAMLFAALRIHSRQST